MVALSNGWPAVAEETRDWTPNPANRGPRADRQLGTYRSAVVPSIAAARLDLEPGTLDAIDAAETSAESLRAPARIDISGITGALLRSESVASSKIEHLSARQDDVALAAFGVDRHGGAAAAASARLVAANISAMAEAVRLGRPGDPLDVDDVLRIHRTLMHTDRFESAEAGRFRTVQNWIGGSDYSPRDALYVPPDPKRLPQGMDDLIAFCQRDDISPVALAAIAHAQFETLHPFADGNGRTGRAIIHLLWQRTALAPAAVIPVSTALLADVDGYFDGLRAYRDGDLNSWLTRFSLATTRAATAGQTLETQLQTLHSMWVQAVRAKSGSAAAALVDRLLGNPVLDAQTAQAVIAAEKVSTYRAIHRLVDAGVLVEVTGYRRNRVWFAPEIFDLLEQFEARLGRRTSPTLPRSG